MGACTGDLAIIAALGDFVFMVRNTSYMHVMPPPIGSNNQEIGDPWNVHAKFSGCCDVIADNDEECLSKCGQLLSYLPQNNMPFLTDLRQNIRLSLTIVGENERNVPVSGRFLDNIGNICSQRCTENGQQED